MSAVPAARLVDAYPMAQLQLGMVYEMERDPERLPYLNVHTLRVTTEQPFDAGRFRDAVARAVRRHAVLRTSFAVVGFSEPMQLVFDSAEVPITVVDLRGASEDEARSAVGDFLAAERRTPLDLTVAPLCRMGVHIFSDDVFQWTIAEHHAILDGWSLASVASEILAAYRASAEGPVPAFEPLASSYRDFIAAERAAMASAETRAFWHDQLAELPDCRLPRWPSDRTPKLDAPGRFDDRHLHDVSQGCGSLVSALPQELSLGLRDLANRCHLPLRSVLLAAHVKVLSLVTSSPDVVTGLTANGRLEDAQGAEVCGLFVNTVPFRHELAADAGWDELIRDVFEAETAILPHCRYPMGVLQHELGGSALFETSFVYTDFQQLGADAAGNAPLGQVSRTHFAMVTTFSRNAQTDALTLELEYDARAFPRAQVRILRDYIVRVLQAMVRSPKAPHQWASLLGRDERALLDSWNANRAEIPATVLHRMVEERAAASPDAVALVSESGQLTYAQLNARANRLAWRLRELGVGVDTAVGVCVERSVEMIVGWLAVLKTGGMYVPLDPAFPAERLAYMLKQSNAPLVLTAGAGAAGVPAGPWQLLAIDAEHEAGRTENLPDGAGPDNGCYVIFTSGSTGLPKGVLTRHRNVVELLCGGDVMTVLPEDTVLQIAPSAFDVSTFEVWAPLVAGARLVLPPPVRFGPAELTAWVAAAKVTVLHATASLFALLVDHAPQIFDGLRRCLTGSETVSPGHTARILERCPQLEVVNCWGPTETTTFSVCGAFHRGEVPAGPLPLGVPLANTEVWVLDEAGMPVPIGSPGELYVSGPCLARGYVGRPGLTGERFTPHPDEPGERLYRTGDRGRWSVDGLVEFLGRTDHMVKVRGYRVELGEVEAVLAEHPGVRECVVVTWRQESLASVDLVAYLVAEGEAPSVAQLRAWLSRRLPPYMVPRLFVVLDAMPLTSRAKIDRRALPAPEDVRPTLEQEFVAPEGELEELLARIWCGVLRVDRVGRHDNFFDLGGDSIRSIQILGAAREAGLTVSLTQLLAHPTPAGLADAIAEAASAADAAGAGGARDADEARAAEPFALVAAEDRPLLPPGLQDAYPMAELQAGMVYEMELDRERNTYLNVHTLRLNGSFDATAFRAALARVVARHAILRTSFDTSRFSEPMQLVHPSAEIPLEIVDLTAHRDADEHQAAIRAYVHAQQRTRFDLGAAPLCRMGVHLLPGEAFQWTITEHHAILDGWSLATLVADILDLYRRLVAGEDLVASPLRSTYRDFIAAEREALGSAESRAFWHGRLAGRPDGSLPHWPHERAPELDAAPAPGYRHSSGVEQGYGSLVGELPRPLVDSLQELARRCRVPLKSVLLAGFVKVLSVISGSSDVVTGLSSNGRLEDADGTDVCGLFVNTVPFCQSLPHGTWLDLIRAVFETEHDLAAYRRYPLGVLQRELGGSSLFESNFLYTDFRQVTQLADDGTLAGSPDGAADSAISGVARTNFPLNVSLGREPGTDGLRLELDYHTDVLTAGQIHLFRDYLARVFEAMTTRPDADHRWASLLGAAELGSVLSWNANTAATPAPASPVHRLVEARAAVAPGAVAVVAGDVQLTYAELNARANRLARRLRGVGAGPDVPVALFLGRSAELVTGLLAVCKAGGVCVPIEPGLPADQATYMLREVAAPLVLTVPEHAASVPPGPWRVLTLSASDWAEGDTGNLADVAGPDHGCAIVFTPGSAGALTGVVVLHRNVSALLQGAPLRPDDALVQLAPFTSDASLFAVWAPLVAGARLVLAPSAQAGPGQVAAWVAESKATVLLADASLFAPLVDHEPQTFDGLRRFMAGSGTLSPSHAARILEHRHDLELIESRDRAETPAFTVSEVYRRADAPDAPDAPDEAFVQRESLISGEVWVFDEAGMLTPVGTWGELCLSGPCLPRGYLGHPGLTAEQFVPHPFATGQRLWRTGERARWSVDGRVELFAWADAAPPESEEQPADAPYEFAEPVGTLERLLAGIWCAVLGIDRVGRHDNFFQLGGDSIRSIQVLGQVRDAGIELGLRDLLDSPTLAELAAVLTRLVGARPSSTSAETTDAAEVDRSFSLISDEDRRLLPDSGLEDAYPMAQLQVGMVYEMERDHALNAYLNVNTVRLTGVFDRAVFQDAIARVVARHPALRTSFDLVRYSEPMQLVHTTAEMPLTVVDLRTLAADQQRDTVRRHIRHEQYARLDLATAPLLRMAVHVLSDASFQWTTTEHHAVLDGWSLVSTLEEIVDVYQRLLAGENPPVEPLRSTFRDFIAAERAALDSAETREFWRERLTLPPDARVPRPPTGTVTDARPGGESANDSGTDDGHGALTTEVPEELLRKLVRFAGRAGLPLKTALLTAHLKVVGLLTGSADVLVGLTANGRLEQADGAEARGLFLNTVPLRLDLPEGSWRELARAVFRAERDLLTHRRYPMAALQREFGGQEPLLEISFTYTDFHRVVRLAADGTLDLAEADEASAVSGVARTNFPLDVTFSREPSDGGLYLEIDYSLDVLTPGQAALIRDYHLRALHAMVERDGNRHHRAVPLLGEEESRLLASWQGSDAPVSGLPVHELLRERVALWPGAVAVESDDECLTFAELDIRSEALACRLVAAGVVRGDVVGLGLRPGVGALVAVWGVWKAGGAFMPLDPDLPAARLEMMTQDARPRIVVGAADVEGLDDADVPDVALPRVGASDLAYVMFTSGSTGRPKGVMVEHGGLANFAEALLLPRLRYGGIGEHARVLAGTSAFVSDFFLEQILPLLEGHRLLVLSGANSRDPRHLVERAGSRESAVEIIDATTSQVQLMVEAGLLDAPYPPRLLTIGGEACPPDLWARLRSRPGVVGAHNTYGPAETAVDATFSDLADAPSPHIGRPYGNVRVYLLDEALQLVPPGTPGELVIGGPGVGRGYAGRPGVTAAAFVPDPWGTKPGARLYRTGDLGRYTAEGNIEYLGRNDHQVKILGQRVEPEEVEAVLRTHPAVAAAAVTAQILGGRLQLVAHIVSVPGVEVDRDEIFGYLATRLPAAAVPSVLVPLAELPMTDGGKLDRKALSVPEDIEVLQRGPDRERVAPRGETEARIAAVWEGLLGAGPVGVFDDFFASGGHSLLAIRLAMRASAELGVELPLHEVFAHPTVAAQAELIDGASAHDPSDGAIPVAQREPSGTTVLPASHAQERQWFIWRLAPESPLYHVPWGYEVSGELDVERLRRCVDVLIERHETLRTTLEVDADSGRVVQHIGTAWKCPLAVADIDASALAGELAEFQRTPFTLTTGPVFRAKVWRVAPASYRVLFVAHHVAVDEWSLEVFERELWALYEADADPEAAGLAPLPVQYADYAAWHRSIVESRADEDLDYWRRALDGATATRLPRLGGDVAAEDTGPAPIHTVSGEELAGLDEVRAQVGATDFMLYLAVYCLLLARLTGERDITVGVPVSGRSHPDASPMIGFFVNTLALRVTIDPHEDFAQYLRRVRSVVLDAFAHQEAPFEQVVRAVAPGRADGENPLFGALFSFSNAEGLDARLDATAPAGLTLRDLPLAGGNGARFDLSLFATRMADSMSVGLEFSRALLDDAAAEGLLGSFADLLGALDSSPRRPVSELLRANAREREVLAQWQGSVADMPTAPVHEVLRERAALWPDAVAVESDDKRLTFAELDTRSEALACRLAAAGVVRGDVVGLSLRPGVDALVAAWGVWKAGGAFMPLDPDLPAARLEMMTQDARPRIVLTAVDLTSNERPDVALPRVGASDLAYVLFTSGSTGRPKGAMVEHGNLANFAQRLLGRFRAAGIGTGSHARVLVGTSAFVSDFFLEQILPLLDGHRLLVLADAEQRDPRYLLERAQSAERAVDAICATTSQIQLMVEAGLLHAPYPPKLVEPAGEACPPDLWRALGSRPGVVVGHNVYGPTEATVDATYADLAGEPMPHIGRPYGNVRVYLVDEELQLVPPGSPGEIVIGGPGVGRGYASRPDATAAVFVPDPWGTKPGARLYRTGDLGRYTADGLIEFLGRNDHQVKILGQRVEPEEVEALLRAHPAVAAAVVTAQTLGGRLQLVAHIVPAAGAEADRDEILGYLAARLPAAAVPSVLVPLAELPMTVGGKTDRKALTDSVTTEAITDAVQHTVVLPRTATERRIAEVWQAVLGIDQIGVSDDFFALGGHSLAAVRLAMRVSAELGVELALHEVFAHPTVAAQAELIDGAGADASAEVIPRVDRGSAAASVALAASHAQERQWFIWRLAPESPTYHVPWGYEVSGELDVERLRRCVDVLVERHEALRTTLEVDADSGRVVQRVGRARPIALTVSDIGASELAETLADFTRRPFDLTAGPVFRARVWRVAPGSHRVLFVAHHVAVDEWSLEVFERELWALYEADCNADAAGLAPLAIQYSDYAAWHRSIVERRAEEDLDYWRRALDGAKATRLPHATVHTDGAGRELARLLPAGQDRGLESARAETGATDFMLYLAVYCLLLARLTGERDITVGVPVSGRSHPDASPMIGFFVNTLAMRVEVRPEDDFTTLLRRVRLVVLDAFAHQEAPFEQVVRAVAPGRGQGENPLFGTMFSFMSVEHLEGRFDRTGPAGLVLQDLDLAADGSGGAARFDLSLDATRTADGGLHVNLEFSTALLDDATADGLLDTFADLLGALNASPRTPVAELLRANAREREVLAQWQGSDAPVSGLPVHELLRERVALWPGAVAVESDDKCLTFAELDTRSEALARRLVAAGVVRGDVVGLGLRPGVGALVAVWGVWKAGGAFMPLDPDLPAARLEMMTQDARPATVLTAEDLASNESPDVALPRVGASDLAYVMFTSGSTGRPKGVMVEHGGLANFAEALLLPRLRYGGIGEHARVLAGTSAFVSDFFLEQILPLLEGHRLLVLSGAEARDPRHLVERAGSRESAVEIIDATTSQVQLMVEAGLLDAPYPPRLLTIGGEACPPDLWARLRSRPGVVGAHNTYGPAETAVDATFADLADGPSPHIGRPYGNVRVYLVDEALHLVPPGTPGELVIGGPGVGRGYAGRPGVTAAVFVPDPWGTKPGARLYRTGDLGRYTAEGNIEYLGRNDHQVKILGQRVEPEEVEAVLRAHPAVAAAAVTAQTLDGRTHLIAHVVPAVPGADPDREEIRGYFAARLPAAAVPSVLVPLAELPMTDGGKLDRKALTIPADLIAAQRPDGAIVLPRTETEARIVEVWQAVLGVERVGVFDDFFALGGHSLAAVRLAMRVSAELGAELALHEVFAHPTVAGQAELIDAADAGTPAEVIPRAERGSAGYSAPLAASHAQERQWFIWRLAPESPTYHVPWGYEVVGALDVRALNAAIDALTRRHEALRTTLEVDADSGRVVQRVGPVRPIALAALDVDASELPGALADFTRRPFDLTTGPLLRAGLWRTAPDRHAVLFVAHHVAVDEWSLEVFEHELWALYETCGDPEVAGLAPLPVQYADYAAWHRSIVERRADEDLDYWRRALDGAKATRLPHATIHTNGAGREFARFLPAGQDRGLGSARAQCGATDFMLCLAVYCLLLARLTGERDITVGVPVSGRSHPDASPMIGFFVNTLALRVTIDPHEDFAQYLRRVRSVVLDAFAHQEAPFEQVVRAVAPGRGQGENPLFGTMFSYTSVEHLEGRFDRTGPAGLVLQDLDLAADGSGGAARFDLSLNTTRTGDGGLHVNLEFSSALLDAAAAEGLLDSLSDLLALLDASPASRVEELLRTNVREQDMLASWQASVTQTPSVPSDLAAEEPSDSLTVLPRTDIETRIAAVWQQLLGVESVGVFDDFFALGGHSLLAIHLGLELQRELGVVIPMADFYTSSTIAAQAVRVEALKAASSAAARPSSLVRLGGGSRRSRAARPSVLRPLVLVHPLGGTLFQYRDLVHELGSGFEALGLQGDFEAGDAGARNFATLAGRYADELAGVLAERPGDAAPVIAGWSAGGVLAHELARTLAERGHRVHRLVVIDADPRPDLEDDASYRRDVEIFEALRREVLAENGPRPLLRSAEADRLLSVLGVDPKALSALDGATTAGLLSFWRGMLEGSVAHRPARFAGPADLVVAGAAAPPHGDDGHSVIAAWRELTGSLEVTRVDGADHFRLLRRPWVKAVADVLRGSTGTGQAGD